MRLLYCPITRFHPYCWSDISVLVGGHYLWLLWLDAAHHFDLQVC